MRFVLFADMPGVRILNIFLPFTDKILNFLINIYLFVSSCFISNR